MIFWQNFIETWHFILLIVHNIFLSFKYVFYKFLTYKLYYQVLCRTRSTLLVNYLLDIQYVHVAPVLYVSKNSCFGRTVWKCWVSQFYWKGVWLMQHVMVNHQCFLFIYQARCGIVSTDDKRNTDPSTPDLSKTVRFVYIYMQ